ncbi:MAG: SMC-Scp complex subunit ScpB [Synechococcaceae cyanobacterium RL_1_2]|nr:SMC-Scp complex subunit ScpB [Synechococcaceae cyanobacterium RL_1_2]
MADIKLSNHLEAILYIKGRPLTVDQLGDYTAQDRATVEDAMLELMEDYAHRQSALELIETDQGYCLQLRPAYLHLLQDHIPAELGTGALRTLAAIALKSPILQTDLIEIRGSSAYEHIKELLTLDFVRRKPQPDGRSYWLEVTDKFHQYFEIDQISQVLE